jgi:putative ABC transport system ATP-binding protein
MSETPESKAVVAGRPDQAGDLGACGGTEPAERNSADAGAPTGPAELLSVLELAKQYLTGDGPVRVLHCVNLTVNRREMLAIMGESGSGKSTLLFILGLLLAPSAGAYRMLGKNMFDLDRREQAWIRCRWLGFVFQSADLVEASTVCENLELPLIYAEVDEGERQTRIGEALERVHMTHRLTHAAGCLSAGERQRVAIARALVNRPKLVLADEPTGQLDRTNGNRVLDYFEKIVKESDTSVLVVTHDPEVARRCGRILRLEEGVLVEQE